MSLPSQVANWNHAQAHGGGDDEDWWGEAGAETWEYTSEGQNGYNSGSSGGTGSVGSGSGGGGDGIGGGGSTATTMEAGHHQNANSMSSSSWAGKMESLKKRAVSMPNPITDQEIVGVDAGGPGTFGMHEEGTERAQHAIVSGSGDTDALGSDNPSHGNINNDNDGYTSSQSSSKLLHVSHFTMQPLEDLMVRCWADDPGARPSMGTLRVL